MAKNLKYQLLECLWLQSLKAAAQQQSLSGLIKKLERIVPDLTHQYSRVNLDNEYLVTKVRNMHAFQLRLIGRVINEIQDVTIVDIGDSSGTHLQYVKEFFLKNRKHRCLSVNLDKIAVEKIKAKGMEAIQERAEDLCKHNISADIFLSFEMLEHLMNPCSFLHNLSTKTQAKYLIITVPYLRVSRVGLDYVRNNWKEKVDAEGTHIFELSPGDWKLVFQFSGWHVYYEEIYRQYPCCHWLTLTRKIWRKYDFEGFYGVILTRENSKSSQYIDW
jgi:hypothetical protein